MNRDLTPIWVATRGTADMFTVYAFSLGGTEKKLRSFPTFDEAVQFCEDYEWTWLDPVNPLGYEWDLEIIEEENENAI